MEEHGWIIRKFPTGMCARDRSWVMESRPDVNGKVVAQVIATPTTNPDWEKIAPLIAAAPELLKACKAFNAYWQECARIWHANEGRVAETKNGAIVTGGNLDELAEHAAYLVMEAIAKAEDNA